MNERTSRASFARVVVALLLLSAAFWAALPWLSCVAAVRGGVDVTMLRVCTFGAPGWEWAKGIPGFAGPFYGSLLAGGVYVVAAVLLVVTKRRL